ncbi:MAG TPA: preprotein translocase subunit SecE [Clostridia bacterium]|nr:preprotein translocase subunit SecE [Clostridia bacterium]
MWIGVKLKKFFSGLARYFREVKAEMKKVTWPSRKEIVSNTLIVIVAVIIASIIVGVFDLAVVGVLKSIIG